MKHIFHSLDECKPQGLTLATFFFNGRDRGNESLTTLLFLYRALLNQILYQSPENLPELTSEYKEFKKSRGGSWKWSIEDLRLYFSKVVPKISTKRHICILVDALDESGEENARELIRQFQETLAAVTKLDGVLKICFSCRHYPILTLKYGLTVTMEIENRKDIETFVKRRLTAFEGDASVIEKAILQKAEGVFQWAKLVANQALDLQIGGQKVQTILLKIKRLPKQLEELYESLLSWPDQEEEQENRRKALELFQWMFFGAESFTLAKARYVLEIDEQVDDTLEEYLEDVRSREDEDRVRRAVRTLSRGLIEFRLQRHSAYAKDVHVLQPIHQTVQEYLLEKGLRQLQCSPIEGTIADPHYQIFKTSVKFLFLEESLKEPIAKNEDRFHFLEYSLKYLGYHFWRTDQEKVNLEELLDLFQWPSKSQQPTKWNKFFFDNIFIKNSTHPKSGEIYSFPEFEISGWHFDWPRNSGSTLLHLAAFVGNICILESAIKRDNDCDLHAKDELGRTPLLIAVGLGHEEFALWILSHTKGLEIDEGHLQEDRIKTTIIHEAARQGMTRTLQKLLEFGVDVDVIGPGPQSSPLFEAVREGQLETCRKLLNHQANPEIAQEYFGTPLSFAILLRNKELSCFLVQNCDEERSSSPAPTRANVYNALWPSSSYNYQWYGDEESYADSVFRAISSEVYGDFIREVLGPISTPLHDACARGNIKVASFLINKAEFDVNGKDDAGRTPIFRAVQEEQHAMIEWLFQNHGVHYLSQDDWSQLPGNTMVRGTYQQAVEKSWCAAGLPSSQRHENPNIEHNRQLALKAFEDLQYCLEPEVVDAPSPQGSVVFERNAFSFHPTMSENHEERSAKRRKLDGGEEL